jgi:hypothetical protein
MGLKTVRHVAILPEELPRTRLRRQRQENGVILLMLEMNDKIQRARRYVFSRAI